MNGHFLLGLGLIVAGNSSLGQTPYFKQYNLFARNETVEIKSLSQERSGYLWIGTDKGLFRFDGVSKKRFTKNDGLQEDIISATAQDSLGRIWVGHENGMISYQEGERFVKFETEEGSAGAEISKIHFDRNGVLWFSTLNDGIYYYKNKRLYRLDEADGMPDIFVYDFVEGGDGKIYAGTDLGVAIIDLKTEKVSIEIINSGNGLTDNIVTRLMRRGDRIWLVTQDRGIFYLSDENKPTALNPNWNLGTVRDFALVDDKVWFVTESGVYWQGIDGEEIKKISTGELNNTSFNRMLQDREGNIWLGHVQALVRLFADYIQFIDTYEECQAHNIVALTIDKDANLWFSSNEGLYKKSLAPASRAKKQLVNTPYENYPIISLYADTENNLWAGTYGMGLLKIDLITGETLSIKNQLRNGNVLSIQGIDREVWLATLGGASQILFDHKKLDIKNFDQHDGLLSDYNYQVFLDSKKRKWFATDGKWAMILDNGNFSHVIDTTLSKVFFGFDEDVNGNVWVNIQNGGIHRIDKERIQSVEKYTFQENISSFKCDGSGNLVAFNDSGIDLINSTTGEVRHFGEEYGIENRKPNLNAVVKDGSGNIYFGTSNGIVVYSTKINQYPQRPQAKIEFITNSNKTIAPDRPLDFSYNQNDLVMNYTAFWYQNPSELSFSYKLENFDDHWIMSRDRYATYSNLPPGEYTFRLKASSNLDFQFQDEVTLSFVISPPFWRRAWFYVLLTGIIIYFSYRYIRYREQSLVRENQLLEMKVKERFAEILKKNEEIMAQAEEIKSINDNLEKMVKERTEQLELKNKVLAEAAFFNSHKLRAPVASLLGLTSLIKRLKLANEDRDYLKHFETSCQKLDDVIKSITSTIEQADLPDLENPE